MTEMKETLHETETEKFKSPEVEPPHVLSDLQGPGTVTVAVPDPPAPVSVLGLFKSDESAASVIRGLNNSPWTFKRVYSPIPSAVIMNALKLKKSRVGWFTLAGGVIGFLSGFALAVFSATRWNIIVGGKPVLAWVPFFIVGFEFTILFAVFGNIVGLLTQTGLPQLGKLDDGYDPGCSADRFGVLASCDPGQQDELGDYYLRNGAKVKYFY
jgi:molybdopterin-containing oxidoreductase family membrane subunit